MINNILMTNLGTPGLAVYSVVNSIFPLFVTASDGMRAALCPMIGVFYGARDKNGVKKTLVEGLKVTYLFSLVWLAIIFFALNPLIRVYMNSSEAADMQGIIRTGVYIVAAFLPITLFARALVGFYESINRPLLSIAFAAIPDSLIVPLLLWILVPAMGYNGTWLACGSCEAVFLLIFIAAFLLRNRARRLSLEDFLFLDESIRDNVPMKDISIRYRNSDISGLSAEIQAFLDGNGASKRTAYMCVLCLEELAADFIAHAQDVGGKINEEREFMDIKLFSDVETFRIVMRNIAGKYNPLDFEYDPENFAKIGVRMAQRVARKITYDYVYKMNIVTIDVGK